MTLDEERIKKEAVDYAKKHKKEIAKRLTDPKRFIPEKTPVSVFMAGSPGAGKTEAAIELLASIAKKDGVEILYIDPDGKKIVFPENASPDFKKAFTRSWGFISRDCADDIFAELEKSKQIYTREALEGRRINPQDFIYQYFAARDVVNRLKAEFGKGVHVDLLLKNNDNSHRLYKAGIDRIDSHVPEKYTRANIEQLLGLV